MRISIARPTATALASLSLAVAGLLAGGTAANAYDGYAPIGSFGGEGSTPGLFTAPTAVAIDQSSGDVYVSDSTGNRVEKFDSTGKFLLQFEGSETPAKKLEDPSSIAVDNSGGPRNGDIYVDDEPQQVVDVFNSAGKYVSQINVEGYYYAPYYDSAITIDASGHLWLYAPLRVEEYSETGSVLLNHYIERYPTPGIAIDSHGNVYILSEGGKVIRLEPPAYNETNGSAPGAVALAINPATGNIFQDLASSIVEWPPFGEGKGELWSEITEEFTGPFTNSQGLAIYGATGALYVSDLNSDKVEIFKQVITPDVATEPASQLTDECATFEGKFNALGTKAEWYFEYGETTAYGSKTIPVSDTNNGSETISSRVCGLEGFTNYHFRLVGVNENSNHIGKDAEFTTPAHPPVDEAPGGEATEISRTRAVMKAQIDPYKSETSYYFEYGETTAYGTRTALTELASSEGGKVPLLAQAVAKELKAHTVIHFRVVARNAGGTIDGPDITFTSGSLTPPLVMTQGVSNLSPIGATLEGLVTTQGLVTSYGFEISTSRETFGPPTGLGSVGAGFAEAPATLTVTGLKPDTTYYYKLVGTNTDGGSEGEVKEFTTLTYPPDQITVDQLRVLTEPFTEWPVVTNPLFVKEEAKTKPSVKCKKGSVKKNGKCVKKHTKRKGKGKAKKKR